MKYIFASDYDGTLSQNSVKDVTKAAEYICSSVADAIKILLEKQKCDEENKIDH